MTMSNSEIKTFIVCDDERVESETSSKGNQVKFHKDNLWIKQDCLGYEGLAEVVASRLASLLRISCVTYEPCYVYALETGKHGIGCYSSDFIPENTVEISLQRLVQKCTGYSCNELLESCEDTVYAKIDRLAKAVERFIDRNIFINYLGRLLYFDSLIVNEDRHWQNIVFLYTDTGQLVPAPVFDNGAGFFSDTSRDYPFELELDFCFEKVKAKPFSVSFSEQAKTALTLITEPLHSLMFAAIDYSDLQAVYDKDAIDRVKAVLRKTLNQA